MMKLGKRMITALALATVCLATPAQAQPVPLDSVVAIANDGVILRSELDRKIALISSQLSARGTQLPARSTLERQVLEQMIIESLQLQVGKQQGIRISDEMLNRNIERIAERNGMTLLQFRDALVAEGNSYEDARLEIGRNMLLQQIQQSNIGRRIKVSDQEIKNYLGSAEGQKRNQADYKLSHILIAIPSRATPEMIQRAEEKAQNVYKRLQSGADFAAVATAESNASNALSGGDLGWRKRNEMPEALAVAMGSLGKGEISAPIRNSSGFHILKVEDKRGGAVQLVNQAKVAHILIKMSEIRNQAQSRRLIGRLYNRIVDNGEDFATLAKEYSDDPASGSEGGELGWVQNGQMVPAFEEVMNNTRTGSVSRPFESRFGWHILTVTDRRQQDLGEEMLENQARSIIRKRKFNEELSNWLRELRSQAFIDIKN